MRQPAELPDESDTKDPLVSNHQGAFFNFLVTAFCMRAFFSDFLERIIQIARELPGNAKQLFTAWLGSLSALQLLLGAVILLFVVILILDNHRFVVRRYRVRTDKIRKNMTIVFLTDQHAKVYGEDNEKVIRRIREAAPDAILIGGDMIVSARATQENRGWKEDMVGLVRKLAADYPVYYAPGNHEERLKKLKKIPGFQDVYDHYNKDLVRAGARLLNNDTVPLDAAEICGLELPMPYYKKIIRKMLKAEKLEELFGTTKASQFTILLAHNPRFFSEYAAWGADLVLSGHYHGGMVRIPGIGGVVSPDFRLFPHYSGGRYLLTRDQISAGKKGKRTPAEGREGENGSVMIVSCGMGTHSLPFRFLNPGELSVITIEAENPVSKLEADAAPEKKSAAEGIPAPAAVKPAAEAAPAPAEEKTSEEAVTAPTEEKPAEEAVSAPAEEKPAEEAAAAPAEEKPAEEAVSAPAEEKPAEEAVSAPAEEKPAEEAVPILAEKKLAELSGEETPAPKKKEKKVFAPFRLFGRRKDTENIPEEEYEDPDEAIWDWEPLESHPMARRPIRFDFDEEEESETPVEMPVPEEKDESVKPGTEADIQEKTGLREHRRRGEIRKSFLTRDQEEEIPDPDKPDAGDETASGQPQGDRE